MEFSDHQRRELKQVSRQGQPAHVRVKALALVNLAEGRKVSEVARIFHVSRQSLYEWQRRYALEGVKGLRIRPGRGRKSHVDLEQVKEYLRRSPRAFGLAQTRWTLKAVTQVVPSLAGFSARGAQKVLKRAGLCYKRGQAWLHSPDPQYAEKKGRSIGP